MQIHYPVPVRKLVRLRIYYRDATATLLPCKLGSHTNAVENLRHLQLRVDCTRTATVCIFDAKNKGPSAFEELQVLLRYMQLQQFSPVMQFIYNAVVLSSGRNRTKGTAICVDLMEC